MSIDTELRTDGVVHIRINHYAKRNAITDEMADALVSAFAEASRDRGVRVVCLSGAGGVFSAGADLSVLTAEKGKSPLQRCTFGASLGRVAQSIADSRVPVVCRVDGYALGGGMALAALSTVVVASRTATFRLPEVDLNLLPAELVPLISGRVGAARAVYWAMTGASVSAESALAAGLVDEVVDPECLDQRVEELLIGLAGRPVEVLEAGMTLRRLLRQVEGAAASVDYGRLLSSLAWSDTLIEAADRGDTTALPVR